MVKHLNSIHKQWRQQSTGELEQVTYSPIACQTFHRSKHTCYFPVDTGAQLPSAAAIAATEAAAAKAVKSGQPVP